MGQFVFFESVSTYTHLRKGPNFHSWILGKSFSVFLGNAKVLHSPNTMKLIFILGIIICLFQANNAEFKEEFSKVICSMKRLVPSEIFIGTQLVSDQVILSKRVFQECNFQVRVVSKYNPLGTTDLIAFGYHEKDIKVHIHFEYVIFRYLYSFLITLRNTFQCLV